MLGVGGVPNGICMSLQNRRAIVKSDNLQPARVLDKGTYDYAGSDTVNAQQIKPQTVVDAEFRLSDDMYTLSNMMGGPNGSRVSLPLFTA